MSEEERHVNKRSTGTVPKQRNNSRIFSDVQRLRSLSNSSSDCYPSRDSSNELKNPRRSNQTKDLITESALEDKSFTTPSIGYATLNSIRSSNTSSPTARRNSSSSTLKCDNITKCPNKKQIEDKLNQIHEYLKVTNSLMASMKKTDDQVPGRIDEFSAEGAYESRKNEESANLESMRYNLGFLKDHQQMGYQFRRKSENKHCSPSHNQSNILEVCNDVHSSSSKDLRNYIEFDTALKERSEKMKKTMHTHPQTLSKHDKGFGNVESLHNQIISLHNSNDENEFFIDTLDGADSELASEHAELHKKLTELQNRKFQIDRLVAQLQSFGDTYEDTDNQFQKIYAMKDQLNKLKEMLEVVKMPDMILQNTNNQLDDRNISCYLCLSAEETQEKDVKKPKLKSRIHNDSNVFRNANLISRDSRPKQLNTNSRERGNQLNKANMSSIAQKIALQNELECKKRELEEIMGKHKGNASNLNQDVGIDTKSEISSVTYGMNEPWASIISQESDSDTIPSDDGHDVNNYSELKHNFLSLPFLNYSPTSVAHCQSENSHRSNYAQSTEFQNPNGLSYASEPQSRSNSVGAMGHVKKARASNSGEINSNQVQKQLKMIRSMCDTMLEQQISQEHPSNRQQMQNNLIPSPQRPTPHTQQSHTVNETTTNAEVPPQWHQSNMCNNIGNDVASYYNWLTNNTIQTQSFMLNTLNQCYQMLWMQQRELAFLKNNMAMLQERFKSCSIGPPNNNYSHVSLQTNSQSSPNRRFHEPVVEHKINQDFGIPMPDQFSCPLPTMPLNCLNNTNSQLLDSCLNNINNINRLNVQHNATESDIPGNINHLPNHIWSGQALNNQVVPGNRANNYWDNFRSYSRQNLLSTKNSEVLQNLPPVIDRSNFDNQCVNPFAFISFSKSNSEQDSTGTSQENSSQRTTAREGTDINLDTLSRGVTGDILNINNPMRDNESTELPSKDVRHKDNNDVYFGLPPHINANDAISITHSNISDNCIPEGTKRHEEINEKTSEGLPISKATFEDMRESVYKEVASLISANENRPQFLIQLFKDLQMVKSDNGRYNILQSIERNVTHSTVSSQKVNQQPTKTRNFSLQSAPSLDINSSSNSSSNNDYATHNNIIQEMQLFFEHNEEIIIQNRFAIVLKSFLSSLESLKEISKDAEFHNILENSLENELQKYYGKRLGDVKLQLLENVNYLICDYLGLVRFNEEIINASANNNCSQEPLNVVLTTTQTAENGDLAEADQSQIVNDNIEEGAVGGILDHLSNKIDEKEISDPVSIPSTIQSRSRSTTPSKDQSEIEPELLQL